MFCPAAVVVEDVDVVVVEVAGGHRASPAAVVVRHEKIVMFYPAAVVVEDVDVVVVEVAGGYQLRLAGAGPAAVVVRHGKNSSGRRPLSCCAGP